MSVCPTSWESWDYITWGEGDNLWDCLVPQGTPLGFLWLLTQEIFIPEGGFPLCLAASGQQSGEVPLTVTASAMTEGGFPLAMAGHGGSDDLLALAVSGMGQLGDGVALTISSAETSRGDLPLVLQQPAIPEISLGLVVTGGLPPEVADASLLLQTRGGISSSEAAVSLAVFADNNDATFTILPLVLRGDNQVQGNLHLVLAGMGSGVIAAEMGAVVLGCGRESGAMLPLALPNVSTSVPLEKDSFLPLAVRGPTSAISGDTLPLFIRHHPAAAIPLVLQAPGSESTGGLPLLVLCNPRSDSSLSLTIPGHGASDQGLGLYTHGW